MGSSAAWENNGSNLNAFGSNAAFDNDGDYVNAFGSNAAYYNTGDQVQAFGINAARNNSGNGSIAIGRDTLYNSNGDYNIAIGHEAGELLNNGAFNILIGNGVEAMDNNGNYQLNIGDTIYGDLSNAGTKIGINGTPATYTFEVHGTVGKTSGTTWNVISDRRLKDIQGNYEYGLDEILKLNTVRFKYKAGNPLNLPSNTNEIGFIAQEVKEVIPDSVIQRSNGYYDLDVHPINVALVNAVQELKQESDQEKARLEEEIMLLKAYICSKDPEAPVCKKENKNRAR